MGGTWDIFRYPGIRSDSDMYTLGYNFKPWLESKAIADGPSILRYVRETAAENDIDKNIRYGHQVKKATWSSNDAAWTIEAQRKENAETTIIRCNSILMCSGYYSYENGYTPEFTGRERFSGEVIHPQDWPEKLDYRDKKIVVIGSGATAVTLIPKLADKARHVVMLQRSPTYMVSAPDEDWIANFLRKILPQKTAYAITRWKNIRFQQIVYRRTRTAPDKVKKKLLKMLRKELGPDYDIEKHFTPRYDPWDQRLCLVPNSDFFKAVNSGKASIVTDHIDTFTEKGILLKSGEELDADIIVTATGLNLVVLGSVEFVVDGEFVDISKSFSYKAMMFSDVPNLVSTFGYINASWTLRADLTAEYFCRLLKHMDKSGFRQCTPRLGDAQRNMPAQDWITAFSSGYMQRAMHLLPRQGDRAPWLNTQNYDQDKKMIRGEAIDDGVLSFSNPEQGSAESGSRQFESNAA
jgi:cation diffusion facilitator CzcD-associated flavoprotein CzcO